MAEIFIRKQEIKPGKTERLRELIAELQNEAKADEQGVQDIWADETLHTISLFIEYGGDGEYLVWYLEAESMEQLIAAREASTHPLHEVEDKMMDEVLVDPTETGTFEHVLHGVSPEGSDTFTISNIPASEQ